MRCTSPRTVGYASDGKTIVWSQRKYSKEFPTLQLPCGKCLDCRLDYSRQWAVRCVHEAAMHEKNCFITLTYNDENLGDNRLDKVDLQDFVRSVREHIFVSLVRRIYGGRYKEMLTNSGRQQVRKEHKDALEKLRIGYFAVGEYGEKSKRKHWHILIFNWMPDDLVYKYSNENGDKSYSSELVNGLWQKGETECGSVTFESAQYVARYSMKKLGFGKDQEHNLHPVSLKSLKSAIGKKWLQEHWQDVFSYGELILEGGVRTSIPRYYLKWLEKHHPDAYLHYMTVTKVKQNEEIKERAAREQERVRAINDSRRPFTGPQISKNETRARISEAFRKFSSRYLKF